MTNLKDLTVNNLIRAQCIFVSISKDLEHIAKVDELKKDYNEHWIEQYSREAVESLKRGELEYEFIFENEYSSRCRLYVWNNKLRSCTEFPKSKYVLHATHMNHYNKNEEIVNAKFAQITKKLIEEGFPAI